MFRADYYYAWKRTKAYESLCAGFGARRVVYALQSTYKVWGIGVCFASCTDTPPHAGRPSLGARPRPGLRPRPLAEALAARLVVTFNGWVFGPYFFWGGNSKEASGEIPFVEIDDDGGRKLPRRRLHLTTHI